MENKDTENGKHIQKSNTIILNISKMEYSRFISDAKFCKKILVETIEKYPELFPQGIKADNFQLNGSTRISKKSKFRLKKIVFNGTHFEIRPAWLLSYHRGESQNVKWPLFLLRFGVPFWALALVFGRNAMYWYRLFISLARNSIVGTTVKRVPIPVDLLSDEEHSKTQGGKSYIGTTVAKGCIIGIEVVATAGETDLHQAYSVFKNEALNVEPEYKPHTINCDGWLPLQNALKQLWTKVKLIQCFLHGFIKVRDRATKKLQSTFVIAKNKIWNCYKAVSKREFSQRIRRLSQWANTSVEESPMKTNILDFCNKRDKWNMYYEHPQAYRTSNMLDRIMRLMSRFIYNNQFFHSNNKSATKLMRAFALLYNFSPSCPWTIKLNGGWKSPFERLNKFKYSDDWFINFMMATSLGGYKYYHCKTL